MFSLGHDNGVSTIFDRSLHPATRGHSLKLSVPVCRTELRRRFLGARCVSVWNSLPPSVVEMGSLEGFKRKLDHFMGDVFFEYLDG